MDTHRGTRWSGLVPSAVLISAAVALSSCGADGTARTAGSDGDIVSVDDRQAPSAPALDVSSSTFSDESHEPALQCLEGGSTGAAALYPAEADGHADVWGAVLVEAKAYMPSLASLVPAGSVAEASPTDEGFVLSPGDVVTEQAVRFVRGGRVLADMHAFQTAQGGWLVDGWNICNEIYRK